MKLVEGDPTIQVIDEEEVSNLSNSRYEVDEKSCKNGNFSNISTDFRSKRSSKKSNENWRKVDFSRVEGGFFDTQQGLKDLIEECKTLRESCQFEKEKKWIRQSDAGVFNKKNQNKMKVFHEFGRDSPVKTEKKRKGFKGFRVGGKDKENKTHFNCETNPL